MMLLGQSDAVQIGGWAGVITAIGFIIGAFLRYLGKRDADARAVQEKFAATMETINDRNASLHERISEEAAERSQAMRGCVEENSRLIGRVCTILDRHDRLLSEYEQQGKLRSNT